MPWDETRTCRKILHVVVRYGKNILKTHITWFLDVFFPENNNDRIRLDMSWQMGQHALVDDIFAYVCSVFSGQGVSGLNGPEGNMRPNQCPICPFLFVFGTCS